MSVENRKNSGEAPPPEYSKEKYTDLSGNYDINEASDFKQEFYEELDIRLQLAAKNNRTKTQIQEMVKKAILEYYSKGGIDENERIVSEKLQSKLELLKIELPTSNEINNHAEMLNEEDIKVELDQKPEGVLVQDFSLKKTGEETIDLSVDDLKK